jgi:hypothetical protein
LLDILAEEVAERLQETQAPPAPVADVPPSPEPIVEVSPPSEPVLEQPSGLEQPPLPSVLPPSPREDSVEAIFGEEESPPPLPSDNRTARFIGRLAVGLLLLVVLINIPFFRHGKTLATAMPDSRSLIIRDGLVVTEEDDSEIYVYQDGTFRWISSLDAFEHYGYVWGDVHVVEDGFLDTYEIGPAVHVLLKCASSPHIYRLENGEKRWIVDIEAFETEGHVWEDVRFVSCEYLRNLPDGETIPPGNSPPPQP